jgi:hypothetical protein
MVLGAVMRACFPGNNVVEMAGIHYACFGQRLAFFALKQRKAASENRGKNHTRTGSRI